MPATLARSGLRLAGALAAVAGALVASPAGAQEWSVYAGAGGRFEYNDNYFFVDPDQPPSSSSAGRTGKDSAYTLSVTPFVAAARRTEVSEITALLAIGANKVWGISPNEEYLSGTFSLNGTLREERSTWGGRASYSRSSSLEQAIVDQDVVLARTYTDAAVLEGTYNYRLTERWTIGATAGGYANWYDSVEAIDSQSDDQGYNVIGNLGYDFSDQTRLTYTLGYTYYTSDLTRSDVVTTTLGVVHRFSPQLTISGSVGGFWSDTTAKEDLPGQGTPIAAGENRDDSGTFFGGSLQYAFSDEGLVDIRASQGIAPSGIGTISKYTNASAALSYRFSDRLTGRVGAGYSRNEFPVALDDSASDRTITGQAGLSYRLAERWSLDAGYQYTRTRYAQAAGEPNSNLVFVSVAYNWPGASATGWVGGPADGQGLPGAGPLSLPVPATGQAPELLPFELLTLP
jgi:hypothetical protein